MLKRTHLALGVAVGLYFIPHITGNKFLFLCVVVLASVLPDIESGFSAPKRNKLFSFQPLSVVFHKNALLHTYTFLIPLTLLLIVFYPKIGFPFFLGYSFHIYLDSFSPQGIRPFWPAKMKSAGTIQPGGRIDGILFYVFLAFDLALLIKLFI